MIASAAKKRADPRQYEMGTTLALGRRIDAAGPLSLVLDAPFVVDCFGERVAELFCVAI